MSTSSFYQYYLFIFNYLTTIYEKLYSYIYPSIVYHGKNKWILITGCDTGFGKMLAEQLYSNDYNIIATCINNENVISYNEKYDKSRFVPILCNLTKSADIANLHTEVLKITKTLHGLVNNAGIGIIGPVEWVTMDDYRNVMELNYFAGVNLIKLFMPNFVKDSRIVNVTSMAGKVSTALVSTYSSSKFAFEAFSDSLRNEVKDFGIHVSIIEPGFCKTNIILSFEDKLRSVWNKLSKFTQSKYGEEYLTSFINFFSAVPSIASDPQFVVDAMKHAIGSSSPRGRYMIGLDAWLMLPLVFMPTVIFDFLVSFSKLSVKPAAAQL